MDFKLTAGAVSKMMQGLDVSAPVLQILGSKKIAGQGGSERYRLNISDGVHSHSFAMLATQLNNLIPENKVDNNAIIRADKLISNAVSEKRVLIILELTVLAKGVDVCNIIGSPVQWKEGMTAPSGNPAPVQNGTGRNSNFSSVKTEPGSNSNSFYGKSTPSSSASSAHGVSNFTNLSTSAHMPVKDVTPYNNKCAIRVRVTNKSSIRPYSNSRGEGKLFNMDLMDDTGEIRMAGFNNAVDQFYDLLETGNVYFIKSFAVKTANRQWTTIEHDYELSFTNDTQVYPCLEDIADIPTLCFNFVDIASIEGVDNNSMIDCIGICKRRGEIVNFTARATGKELQKREIVLVDKTNTEIAVTLWGKQAEDFMDDSQPVVVIKGAKVSDFAGKGLSITQSSIMQINPDIKEAHVLRGWFDNEGIHAESQSLSMGGRGGAVGGSSPWKLLREANSQEQVDPDKGDIFMSKVTIMSIKRDNSAYQACPSPTCNKKVIYLDNGLYRCEKCSREYPNFKWRLMISVNFADYSDHCWATCFQETSEIVLGEKSDVLGPMQKEDPEAFDAVIQECVFNSYIVKFRSKMDSFNNETRMRVTVLDIHKLNFAEYARKLSAEIKECGS